MRAGKEENHAHAHMNCVVRCTLTCTYVSFHKKFMHANRHAFLMNFWFQPQFGFGHFETQDASFIQLSLYSELKTNISIDLRTIFVHEISVSKGNIVHGFIGNTMHLPLCVMFAIGAAAVRANFESTLEEGNLTNLYQK